MECDNGLALVMPKPGENDENITITRCVFQIKRSEEILDGK